MVEGDQISVRGVEVEGRPDSGGGLSRLGAGGGGKRQSAVWRVDGRRAVWTDYDMSSFWTNGTVPLL